MRLKLSQKKLGFTLIEMAVVLVIVGLLLGGLLMPISAQIDQQNSKEAKKQLEEIKEALIGHALATGQLPCPADPTIASGSTGAGTSITNCTANSTGVVPWATLGVNETDPWGRRFTYRVTTDFADPVAAATYAGCVPAPVPYSATFALCSTGNINILSAAAGVNVASAIPAVIVSHGKNGAGAYLPDGTKLSASADNDEVENSDADARFVDHNATSTYDDITRWISTPILFNRMVAAGKLP